MSTLKKMLSHAMAYMYLIVFAATATAGFPDRPIEFIIPFGAGGGADIEGRLLAKEMSSILGVPLTPINKPGAGGAITYTYIATTNLGNTDFDYDAMDHIGRVEYQPQPFVVKADSSWKSFNDFVNDCRKNPDTYKIANSGTGSSTHTAAIAIMNAINCKVIHLPKGIKGRNASVLSGEADAMVAPLTGAIRLSKAGKLRILAVPSSKRNAVIPDVPTMGELGYNADLDLFRGLSVAPGTPQSIKDKLFEAMSSAANSKAFKGLAKKKGFTIDPMGPAAFTTFLSSEDKKVKNIFKGANLYKSK